MITYLWIQDLTFYKEHLKEGIKEIHAEYNAKRKADMMPNESLSLFIVEEIESGWTEMTLSPEIRA